MEGYQYTGTNGDFTIDNPMHSSGLYLPVAGNTGLRSAVSPDFGGDSKLDQNHFLIAPKSISNLHSDRDTRNFFCVFEDELWSATGASASQEAARFTDDEECVTLTGGRMWQKTLRTSKTKDVTAEVTIFSLLDTPAEIMTVKITNNASADISFTPVAAVPIYARSADNLRDHRHVTSLLNRAKVLENGVLVKPTLSFDERGHQINDTSYFVIGTDDKGSAPAEFIADADLYLGEGGTFLRPRTLTDKNCKSFKKAPFEVAGKEMIGALKFEAVTLKTGESATFKLAIGATTEPEKDMAAALKVIGKNEEVSRIFDETKAYWDGLTNIHVKTGDAGFDNFMEWIAFQPQLRRIYGCSFLPHHDYGRGGRGWRDLWQDCLALLLTDPDGVRKMILDNFRGVRMDGTNATIIGDKPGEFKADRNGIPRVWMDHGFWPFLTLKLYMDQTGDLEILDENVPYFKDALCHRAEKRDDKYSEDQGVIQKMENGSEYEGSVLEHILIQTLTAIYDVGENGEIRLRGADWNDALDMASHKGESVAFTCGYAGNLKDIAAFLRKYADRTGKDSVSVLAEFKDLITNDDKDLFASGSRKVQFLSDYMMKVSHTVSGNKETIKISDIAEALENKAELMMEQIRNNEWVTDSEGNGWYNGYYDDLGRRVEGEFDTPEGKNIRMMLTGCVFSIMSGTAKEDKISEIVKSADKYLYSKEIGGYRLNTDFKELRTDLGRMFGFSYGDKENGAVFSHMAVMYGNALYKRGFGKEGYKALSTLYDAAANFEVSRIYPGIPEYFNGEGRGLYNYLTGAASWYLLTMVTQSFGVRGNAGDLFIEPALVAEQFGTDHKASISLTFRGKKFEVIFVNPQGKTCGEYEISKVTLDGNKAIEAGKQSATIAADLIDQLDDTVHVIEVFL
jgi:cellobiose phosphorylase